MLIEKNDRRTVVFILESVGWLS